MKLHLSVLVAAVTVVVSPTFAQSNLPAQFRLGVEYSGGPDCPDVQGGAQARTPDDTYGCWAPLADSQPFNGSWLDVRIKPVYALVYVNGKYVGTAEQFTRPFRPLRVGLGPQHVEFKAPGYRTVSFWLNTDAGKVATASGALIKNP